MSAVHDDFPGIQRRLKGLGLYDFPIDREWGPGMRRGIGELLLRAETERGISPPSWPALDARYDWLRDVGPVPRHLDVALGLFGVREYPGAENNPVIMAWRDELRAAGVNVSGYTGDAVPWCGLFMAYVMLTGDRAVVENPLWALNWGKFGEDGGQPELGDVLTFTRDGGGHVALYIGEDRAGYFHVLGANQQDSVNIMRIAKSRMSACRQPPYRVRPASVRPYLISAAGSVSSNEA